MVGNQGSFVTLCVVRNPRRVQLTFQALTRQLNWPVNIYFVVQIKKWRWGIYDQYFVVSGFRGTMVNHYHLAKTHSTSLRLDFWQLSRPWRTTHWWSLSLRKSWMPRHAQSLSLVGGEKAFLCPPSSLFLQQQHLCNKAYSVAIKSHLFWNRKP